jgi:hypothetical protein
MKAPASLSLIQMVLQRLERVSVDSYWAHRASGVRGSLLKLLESEENGSAVDPDDLRRRLETAFEILVRAAPDGPRVADRLAKAGQSSSLGC